MTDETLAAVEPPQSTSPAAKRPRRNAGFEHLPFRLKELGEFFRRRWGVFLPDSADGRVAAFVLIAHLQNGRDPETKIVEQIGLLARWMTDDERDALRARALAEAPYWTADEIAELFGVTEAERTGMRTIGVAGQTSADRAAARNARKNAARKRDREAAARRKAAAAAVRPTAWERELAVLDVLPADRKKFDPIGALIAAVANHPAFAGIQAKQAVHRAVENLERRGRVVRRVRQPAKPGRMPVAMVRRTTDEEASRLQQPTEAAGYRWFLEAKIGQLGDKVRVQEFYNSQDQQDLRERLSLTADHSSQIHEMLQRAFPARSRT